MNQPPPTSMNSPEENDIETHRISVREFVAPMLRTGHLEWGIAGVALARGAEIHGRIQAEHARRDATYKREVPLRRRFHVGGKAIEIGGRIDGLWDDGARVRLEEIKTTTSLSRLWERLLQIDHPYALQLKTYAYLTHLADGRVPECHLLLVSAYDGTRMTLAVPFEPDVFGAWFQGRLSAWSEILDREAARLSERRRQAERVRFPFERPRSGQQELMRSVELAARNGRRLLVQAPTGTGKTIAVMLPLLSHALRNDLRLIYVTPKNSLHGVAMQAAELVRRAGCDLSAVVIHAKQRMCPQDEVVCDPDVCSMAHNYYDKLNEFGLEDAMLAQRVVDPAAFTRAGSSYDVCPFELSLDVARRADLMICDYNYAFSPRGSFLIDPESGRRDLIVVDEAHQLGERVREHLSPALSADDLHEINDGLEAGALSRAGLKARAIIHALQREIHRRRDQQRGELEEIEPDRAFWRQLEQEAGDMVVAFFEAQLKPKPNESVLALYRLLVDLSAAIGRRDASDRFVFDRRQGGGFRVLCCDPREFLRERMRAFSCVVAMSATLKPFAYYRHQLGFGPDDSDAIEIQARFPPENRRVIIVPQVNSLFKQRDRQAPRVAELIRRVTSIQKGNYVAFLPSFSFLSSVARHLRVPGFRVFAQEPRMQPEAVKTLLEKLDQKRKNVILLAVQGGSLGEGVDLPGDRLIGAFVIGPGLPAFSPERKLLRKAYDARGLDGMAFAFVYPGMARSVQAAGRVIRSPTDRGLIVLADHRFLQRDYATCLPSDWYDRRADELVSSGILDDVRAFWRYSHGGDLTMAYEILGIPNCDKVRAARRWFKSRELECAFRDIRRDPLSATEWRALLDQAEEKTLVNTRGPVYRKLGLKDRALSRDQLVQLFQDHPTLMKRPVVLRGKTLVAIGFDVATYEACIC